MADARAAYFAFRYTGSTDDHVAILDFLVHELIVTLELHQTLGREHVKISTVENLIADHLKPGRPQAGVWSSIMED